jgi:phytoene dehydrogenase-like protein
MRMSASQSEPDLVEALVSSSRETIQWLKDSVGVRFVLSFHRQAFLVDGIQKFWGGMVLATEDGGKGLMHDHFQKAKQTGITFWYNCRAKKLIVEDGVVKGVIAVHDGQEKQISAKGTVLACGGFEANKALREIHLGRSWGRAKVRVLLHSSPALREDRSAELHITSETVSA